MTHCKLEKADIQNTTDVLNDVILVVLPALAVSGLGHNFSQIFSTGVSNHNNILSLGKVSRGFQKGLDKLVSIIRNTSISTADYLQHFLMQFWLILAQGRQPNHSYQKPGILQMRQNFINFIHT